MRLTKLIAAGEGIELHGSDRDITGITADSRKVEPGYLFVAIPGTAHDGRAFIPEAVKRGAAAVLIPEDAGETNAQQTQANPLPLAGRARVGGVPANADSKVSVITSPDIRKTISLIAATFYPRQPATIAAITGTSGKTSAAQFTREIWHSLGHKSASLGTLGLVTAKESRYGSLTTPDAITLHRLLDEMAGQGITHLALEASSHGLAMHRLDHAHIKAAAFTNLSRDHLDFHDTMKEYFKVKTRLFAEVLPEGAVAVLNADAEEFAPLARIAKARKQKIISYGIKGEDIELLDAKPDARGQILRFILFGKKQEAVLPVIGDFQAWNALCALGIALACGADEGNAVAALGKISGVPGRLQFIGHSKNGGAVFIDYAHKPDALENVLAAMRPHVEAHKGAKLGLVFGCGGDRDKGKRPMMGTIARQSADWTIVTDDNPRHEDPAVIRKAILAGGTGGDTQEIGDRAKAIAAGIERLGKNDVLIIAGKGHETGQIVGDKTLPFDDATVAKQILQTGN